MVSVASLLNPSPSPSEHNGISSSASRTQSPLSPSLLPSKKQKFSKGAATFVKGKPKGEVNYPPFEVHDNITATEYQKYELKPIGRISEYPKRIPYNSEKKSFQKKTGRDGFEVYQYTFRMPGDDRSKDAYCVMWDYNVGLVRVTALFKSLDHSKTMPAKVMNANPGLREVSHSITGGAISAQGYWVPFEAAKAVAARLCYKIRYVLVPVFGPDFVKMCSKPDDPDFENLSIDRGILRQCKEGVTSIRVQSRESSLAGSSKTPSAYDDLPIWPPPKSLRAKQLKTAEAESGYGTDTDRSDMYPSYPGSPMSIGWTPVNTPRAPNLDNFRFPPRAQEITSYPWAKGSPPSSPRARIMKRSHPDDEASDEEAPSQVGTISPKRRKVSPTPTTKLTPEMEAAYTLVQLSMADTVLAEGKKATRRRRASA